MDVFGNIANNERRKIDKGYLKDFATEKVVRKTPKEIVRQEFEKLLVQVYGYTRQEIDIDYRFPGNTNVKDQKADIVVFNDHFRTNVRILIKVDSPENDFDLVSLSNTMLRSPMYAVWTNGTKIKYFMVEGVKKKRLRSIVDIPKRGFTLDDIGRITKDQLTPAFDLKQIFARIHNYIYVNQGLRYDQIFNEILKLIFCKIEDEKNPSENCEFCVAANEQGGLMPTSVMKRISRLFDEVKMGYSDLFQPEETILLEPNILSYAVGELQKYSLLKTDIDVKGSAFEVIIGRNLRGERGEYFTPRNVCRMMTEILDVKLSDRILDPACGSGGFLLTALNHVRNRVKEGIVRGSIGSLEAKELERLFVENNLVGIDFNPLLVKTAKMNMIMNEAKQDSIFVENSLKSYGSMNQTVRKTIGPNQSDKILTNPPMGAKCKIFDKVILRNFALGYRWVMSKSCWEQTEEILSSQLPEILFIERCLDLLKTGGKLGIVITRGILSNEKDKSLQYTREAIRNKSRIIAVIDLPRETFLPHTGALTSALFLEKIDENNYTPQDYEVFMAVVEKIGHDKRGKTIYKRDEKGDLVFDKDGNLIVDDDLPDIVRSYKSWKKSRNKEEIERGYIVSSSRLTNRLDATYYNPMKEEIYKAFALLSKKYEWKLVTLDSVSKRIFYPHRFKRVYVNNKQGVPFLSGSNIICYDLAKVKYLSKKTKDLEQLLVKRNWVLVTRSGTVGIVIKTPEFLEGFAVSEHVIRIVPDETKIDPGYLAAVLSSEFGQRLLRGGIHGSVVDEITTEYVGSMKIPLIEISAQKEIGSLLDEADHSLSQAFRKITAARENIVKIFSDAQN